MASTTKQKRPNRSEGDLVSPDAPKTPFPATALFYVCMVSIVLVTIGAVFAYLL